MSHRPTDTTTAAGLTALTALSAPKGAARPLEGAADTRKPYEPPRIVKRRSVVNATLFSAMGPTSSAQTMVGN